MTDTIAHPPLPEPAAHMHPNDIRLFAAGIDINAPAYPAAFQFHGGSSAPLFTAQQMREYCDAVALPLLKACRSAIYALRGREHDGFLRDAIKQATGDDT